MAEFAALEKKIVAFLKRRIETMGVDAGGLYNYYQQLANQDRAFASYDVPVANFILQKAKGFANYIEAGAGLGQLVAILAANGLTTVGVESDSRRFHAMCDLFAELPEATSARAVEGLFPNAVQSMISPSTLVIFTCFNSGGTEEYEAAMLAGVAAAGGLVMDLARFCYLKHKPEELDELARRVEALGFLPAEEVHSWNAVPQGRVVYFRRSA